MLDLQIIFRG